MRIGLMFGDAPGGTLADTVQQIVDAESDGFDNAWFGQVFGADVLTVIALAGEKTSRIEIGTAVVPTYPRHPFVMAQQAMTVQSAINGRLTLGIGLSHQPVIESMWGMSYDKPARHMREYLSVLKPLVNDGRVGFNGEVYRTNAGLQVPGGTPFPILIAALAPMMLKIAGELADGTLTWMTGAKTIDSHVAPKINAAAEAAGRPQPRVAVGLPVLVTDDEADGHAKAAQAFQIYGTLVNYKRMLEKEGAANPGEVAIVGNEASVERQIRDLASAGATDFFAAIFPHGDDARASLKRTRDLVHSLIGKV